MIDISALECMSLELKLPETGQPANCVGRFCKNLDGSVPEPYKIHVVLHKKNNGAVPAMLVQNDPAKEPKDIPDFYGYFLTRKEIPDESLQILDWSFFVA